MRITTPVPLCAEMRCDNYAIESVLITSHLTLELCAEHVREARSVRDDVLAALK